MLLTFPTYRAGPVEPTSASASASSQTLGLSHKRPRFLTTSQGHRRLALRTEAPRFRPGHGLSKLRNGRVFKIVRQHLGLRLGQSHCKGKLGLKSRALAQVKEARKLEHSLNKFEFGSQVNLRPVGLPLSNCTVVLGSLLKRMDRAAENAKGRDYSHQVNLLRAQEVAGIKLRDLCVNETGKKVRIESLQLDDPELETAKVRGFGYALLAIKGNPDLVASKEHRPDLQAVPDKMLSTLGGQELVMTALNRISHSRPLAPGSAVTVSGKELEALRSAIANGTVSYRWVDSLVNTSKDLQAVLDIALE